MEKREDSARSVHRFFPGTKRFLLNCWLTTRATVPRNMLVAALFFQRVLKKERRKPESHYSILNVSKNGRVETANDASVENENFCAKRERVSANFYASSFVT